MAHTLGQRSLKQYNTLHPDLQKIIDWGLRFCIVDFTLTEGHRPVERQFELYKKGREFVDGRWKVKNKKWIVTKIDGYNIKGKHNYDPSLAVDFCAYVPGKVEELMWDTSHLVYIASALVSIAEFLFEKGDIEHKLRWGGNWDKDGDLADSNFYDRPHVELYKP